MPKYTPFAAGDSYGRLTILSFAGTNPRGDRLVECECSCDNQTKMITTISLLKAGVKRSCGCEAKEASRARRLQIAPGTRFGRLTIIREVDPTPDDRCFECVCDCSVVKVVRMNTLRTGKTRSCGCLSADKAKDRATTHGMSKSPEFSVWVGLRDRCNNPNGEDYKNYGARGITVCERWNSFENFYTDMGPRPSSKHSIDRKENEKGYEPNNCVWATKSQQARNRRTTRMVTYNGQTKSVIEWSEVTGLPFSTIACRLDRGWDEIRTLTTPVMHGPNAKRV